ncbi:DUF397 domain-containing protein [Streptomyces aidingensis]|uniref:DUF397 domain-containing protein n=1 Tax=Streptomyces aidingensis TaxID=910347 RepID=A0A1I1F5J1_9ACTN|nr:DUF397 domain-containing protein [Streptomyces aidingensis]SFB94665.1 protein of unknown function [Streptomyces aidingensis]
MRGQETGRHAVRLLWAKSSYSSEEGGECVEVAAGARSVYVRDSKDVNGPVMSVRGEIWRCFVAGLR